MDKTALKMAIIFGVFFQHLAFDTDDFEAKSSFPVTIRTKTQYKPK
jgi:hypothetical protein